MRRDQNPRFRISPLAACLAVALGAGGPAVLASAATTMHSKLLDLTAPADRIAARPLGQVHRAGVAKRAVGPNSSHGPTIRSVESCNEAALRAAVMSANDSDTVNIPMGCSVITVTSGAIPILVDNLTLLGPGADTMTIDGGASSGYYDRIFRHYGAGTFAISGVTITGASLINSLDPRGGCIASDGTVKLTQSVVSNCYVQAATNLNARGGAVYGKLGVQLDHSTVTSSEAFSQGGFSRGGAIYSTGYLDIERSTVSNNVAASSAATYSVGGGIAGVYGDVKIGYSTISENYAATGAGVFVGYSTGHSAQITNSTISGNHASEFVGGSVFLVPATISNSTFASNTAVNTQYGVGVYAFNALLAESSIFSNNLTPAGDLGMDVYIVAGTIDGEKNIIVHTPSTTPADTITVCPRLGPLADNGGPTATHALLSGSPAIDAGSNPFVLTFDQRLDGFDRTFGATTDIGAYEWQGDLQDSIFTSRFEFACD